MPPFLVAALRNRVSAVGVAVTTASALLFLSLIALDFLGFLANPYLGILIFIILPALFVVGLLLIPIGLWLDRRQRGDRPASTWPTLDLKDPTTRRMTTFVVVATLVNLAIISIASYGAVRVQRVGVVLWRRMSWGDGARANCPSERAARAHRVRVLPRRSGSRSLPQREAEWIAPARAGHDRQLQPSDSDAARAHARCGTDVRALSRAGSLRRREDQGLLRARRRRGQHRNEDDRSAEGWRTDIGHGQWYRHSLAHEPRERRRVCRHR